MAGQQQCPQSSGAAMAAAHTAPHMPLLHSSCGCPAQEHQVLLSPCSLHQAGVWEGWREGRVEGEAAECVCTPNQQLP